MTGPPPAVAATRSAVRRVLAHLEPGALVLVACSGGTDSLALAAAAAFEAPRARLRAGAVVVDHQLQAGSGEVAATAAGQCRSLGLDPVVVVPVLPGPAGDGPEGAARRARYAALDQAATRLGAAVVLLGHTRDDQAEQVLLGLARGSGARSLAGMPEVRGRYHRPLLGLSRAQTAAACSASALTPWSDPHNADPAFARVRARALLETAEDALGPGVAAALARTAQQLADDAQALEALAAEALQRLGEGPWDPLALTALPRAVRTRVWRAAAIAAGAPAGSLSAAHVEACDALLTDWHGQGPVSLPGGVEGRRTAGRVSIGPATRVE